VTDPALTISIDRTSLSLSALVMTGHADASRVLSVSDYQEPALQARINYAPTGDAHGDMPLSWSYQESILGFNVFYEGATSEAEMRSRIAELVAATGRLTYETTVTVNGADAETWTCRPGTIQPIGGRTRSDMRLYNPVWSVSLPVYPIRSVT